MNPQRPRLPISNYLPLEVSFHHEMKKRVCLTDVGRLPLAISIRHSGGNWVMFVRLKYISDFLTWQYVHIGPQQVFDNEEFDCRTPTDWLRLGYEPGSCDRKPVPGKALLPSNDGTAKCKVLGHSGNVGNRVDSLYSIAVVTEDCRTVVCQGVNHKESSRWRFFKGHFVMWLVLHCPVLHCSIRSPGLPQNQHYPKNHLENTLGSSRLLST